MFHSLAAPNTTPTLSPTAYETSPTPRFHQYVSNPASCSTVGGVDSESFRFSFSEDFAPTGVNDTPSLAVPALCRDPSASPSPISDPFTPTEPLFAQPQIVSPGEYITPRHRLQGDELRFLYGDQFSGQAQYIWHPGVPGIQHAQSYTKFDHTIQYAPLDASVLPACSSGRHRFETSVASVPAVTSAHNADLSWCSAASTQIAKPSPDPVLHHPRPYRPYVPRWQIDPDIDLDQLVLPKVPCSTPVDPPPLVGACIPGCSTSGPAAPTVPTILTPKEFSIFSQTPGTPSIFDESVSDDGLLAFEFQDVSMENEGSEGIDGFEWPEMEDGEDFSAGQDPVPEVQTIVEEDVEVGPAIGLGSCSRVLDIDSLLFQSVPDSVKYPHRSEIGMDFEV
ncbi:hypothetical protein NLI96_g3766 [Meripilus lineatus]|uniref:Uncharacterized protein n=1 Tax=Meripilus lineatus TaxID=2056292 RepID=A0AAD5YIP4_9APHY|nr:hypothetical protein NLI96_g3766 [Physisporinus lineatus]